VADILVSRIQDGDRTRSWDKASNRESSDEKLSDDRDSSAVGLVVAIRQGVCNNSTAESSGVEN